MQIVGIQYYDFTSKEGNNVSMCTIYTTEKMVDSNQCAGYKTDKFSITAVRAMENHEILKIGNEVEFLYNRYGKIAEIRQK